VIPAVISKLSPEGTCFLFIFRFNVDYIYLHTMLSFLWYIPASFFSSENVVVHEFATLCLTSLSVDFSCKVQIFDHNGLEPLIQLLSSPDPDVKKNSVECILNLVQVRQQMSDSDRHSAMNQTIRHLSGWYYIALTKHSC